MANKDFFDEEYDKLERNRENKHAEQFDDWSTRQPPEPVKKNNNKPLYIALICVALVLCLVLGWVLCAIFGATNNSSVSQSKLFDEVLNYLNNEYYKEIPDEKMWAAMESAGTAMLQNAGDRFSRLMSPSTYYKFCNPTSSYDVTDEKGTTGIDFQFVEGIGMYVYDAKIDSSAYGKVEEGDIVVKITDIKTFDNSEMQDILTNSVSQSEFEKSYDNIKSAKFHVLRDGSVFTCNIACEKFTPVSPNFEFVEYYFGDGLTNISTSNVGTAATNTKEARKLEELKNLPDTGYIRIKEFSYILSDGETADDEPKHTVVSEFVEVMEMFANINSKKVEGRTPLKHLILDLKGNPGGNVQYTAQIAGMLITDAKLNDAELKTVSVGGKKRLITQLINKQGVSSPYSVELTYNTYFGAPTDKADIVVWTDGGSASASELLTGALLDYRTAVQMGTKTYGKGIAQTWKELTNYTGTFIVDGKPVTSCWAIYYTVAEYRSPVTNTNIHGLGYTPKVYDGLDTYEKLWEATIDYFNSATSGTGDGVLAAA